MKTKDDQEPDRRQFLATTTAAMIGMGCLSVGLEEAKAHASATGRIILTQDNLNRLFRERHEAGEIRTLARNMRTDIASWVKRECSLTPIQEKRLASFTNDDWGRFKAVLAFVEDTGGTLSINITEPSTALDPYISRLVGQVRDAKGTVTTREATVKVSA